MFDKYLMRQFGKSMKVFHSDNGEEFVNGKMQRYLRDHRALHHWNCSHTPEQLDIVERRHRSIVELGMANCSTVVFLQSIGLRALALYTFSIDCHHLLCLSMRVHFSKYINKILCTHRLESLVAGVFRTRRHMLRISFNQN